MATFTVTGDDTVTLQGRVFNDFATDDTTTIQIPNKLVNIKTGKNGNAIFALNQQGFNGNMRMKLNRGSSDDQFMAAQLSQQQADFVDTALFGGSFVQRSGDGQGNVVSVVYNLAGGVISKIPEGKENVSGDTSQAEVTYDIDFARVTRGIE
jgi:hypothetical protein